ncbi:endo-1,4-beta-xylanase xylA, putative (macronuclear) [Tetrahymena thermophila SB210]|uniref:Endo-1,4-beta-xylanase xylA, putative n=1 Tax=Tetrahymena thermophila (strain SB210) TaxID=312017 RepID=I7LX40_TETTS|nr:endo-1,4-beta-xylanase xylA, putative [Tetrahymena thermophila SB210]EAS03717.2 endo-1,4-beta-xylanase xylA, putative [Tetrahymena thermophila SB210]|eukprot:XP_001023962.2 endo-1,4-beta-xylanase xylA, putative [Tetrahymena thermophila SB210]
MKKTSQSVSQPQSSYKQKQPDQQGILREGEKLTAEQIKEFLHESRQNSECSNFDETINNQQKMEKIMIKQNFLEMNQLFDPIEYFGGLKVKDLNQKVDDQRLSDMFKIQAEENNTEKSDLISYHVKNVQQSVMQKNQEQLKNQNWIDKDKQVKTYYFNQSQTSSLLGYSQQQQQNNKYATKSAQSPGQQQLIKQNSYQSCDKENFSCIKQNQSLQQKGASFNSPLNTKISQTLQQNYSSFTQTQEPPNNNGILNITPLKQISQNIQFSSPSQLAQNTQLNNSKMNKKETEMMISPEQIAKQKLQQQNNTGNPLIFSFQQNGAAVNGLSLNTDVLKSQNNSLEQIQKVFNNKSGQQSTSQTPSKNHTTKDVKIACIPNDTSPSSHKVVACKPLSQKKEGDLNRIQLLQAVEQINIESQRKNGDSSFNSSVTPKSVTPSNKVMKHDHSRMNISNTFKQESNLNGKNSQISQQHMQSVNFGDNLSLCNQAKISQTDKIAANEEFSTNNQFLSQQEHQDEIEFYDCSNWQSVQQISQQFQSVDNNGQVYNTQNAINKNCSIQSVQDGLINIQENVYSQQTNGFQTLSKSSLHHRSQSKMFEQKQTSEQFFKDKENLELTFQEETANNEEQQSETEFNCQNLQSSLNQIQHCSPSTYTQFKQEITHSPEKNYEEVSQCQNNLYNKIASLNKHNNANQLQNYRNNLGQESQQSQQNDNLSQNFKKHKEKSKSMIQGELTNGGMSQKSGTSQNQYSSRNNSREIQKKNSYFVQRQMNSGTTTNKLKSLITSNTPQNSTMNVSSKGKLQENSQLGKINQSSYNNSKMSSSILLQEKSLIFCDKSQATNVYTSQNTNNILQNSNIQEKQMTQNYTQQYQSKQQIANLPSKVIQNKKSSSQATNRKDNFLSPKVSQRNTPRSNSQYSSIDYTNTNQSQSTSNAYQSKRGHNKSQPNLCIQPLSNSNIQNNSQTKINYGISQNLPNYTTNIINNNNVLQNNTSGGMNNYCNNSNINNATTNQLANITSSQNSQMTNGILSTLSNAYLKRPSGKSIQYDYKNITNQASNLSKNRLASSPTHSPNNYKIKPVIINNQNQTLRQKKLMSRLDQNTSKNNSQALSFRDQQTNHLNIQAPNAGSNSIKTNTNQSNLLQSITVNSGKYNPDQFDKDLKYNIAIEAKKALFKIDPKYEESLNHLMSMQARHQTSQSSLYLNQNQLSQGNLQQFTTTTTATTPSNYQTNNISNKNQIQNYQK